MYFLIKELVQHSSQLVVGPSLLLSLYSVSPLLSSLLLSVCYLTKQYPLACTNYISHLATLYLPLPVLVTVTPTVPFVPGFNWHFFLSSSVAYCCLLWFQFFLSRFLWVRLGSVLKFSAELLLLFPPSLSPVSCLQWGCCWKQWPGPGCRIIDSIQFRPWYTWEFHSDGSAWE